MVKNWKFGVLENTFALYNLYICFVWQLLAKQCKASDKKQSNNCQQLLGLALGIACQMFYAAWHAGTNWMSSEECTIDRHHRANGNRWTEIVVCVWYIIHLNSFHHCNMYIMLICKIHFFISSSSLFISWQVSYRHVKSSIECG